MLGRVAWQLREGFGVLGGKELCSLASRVCSEVGVARLPAPLQDAPLEEEESWFLEARGRR